MGLLASGALLIAVDPRAEDAVRDALEHVSIPCFRIGRIRPAKDGLKWVREGREETLPQFVSDELVKAFSGAV
jgi:hydrogenase maturation factor